MGRPGLLLYFDLLPALDKLPVESVGRLLLNALHYAQSGVEPVFNDDVALAFGWAFLKPSIDRDGTAYETKRSRGEWLTYCRRCKRDGTEPLNFDEWQQANDTPLRTDTEPLPTATPLTASTSTAISTSDYIGADKPPIHPRFVPPSVEEVRAYCQERKNQVDPERFFDFYTSKNWMIGKNKMKDWKASIRLWERGENHGSLSSSSVDRGKVESRWGTIQSVQLD